MTGSRIARPLASAFLAAAASLVGSHRAGAQATTASLGAGVVSVRYADAIDVTLATLTPTLSWSTARAAVTGSGTFAFGSGASWSANGTVAGTAYTPLSRSGWLGEAGATAGGSGHEDGAGTGQLLAIVRVHRLGAALGAWAGAATGAMWDGGARGAVRQGELGVSARGERLTALAMLAPTLALDSLRYTDLRGALSLARGRFDYRLAVGARLGDALPFAAKDERVWGDLAVTTWIGERLAIVASGGTYPVDPTQGYPSGRFVALALRAGSRRSTVAHALARGDEATRDAAARAGIESFRHAPVEGGRVRLRVRAPDAARVELMGDLTGWAPVELRRDGGRWWVIELDAVPGLHELTLRVDGGPWVVPPGLPVSRDEFGGTAGVLVVPGR